MSREGVPCPECGDRNSTVTDSRGREAGHTYRRRQCKNCDVRFSTVEMSEVAFNDLLKAQMVAEAFRKPNFEYAYEQKMKCPV